MQPLQYLTSHIFHNSQSKPFTFNNPAPSGDTLVVLIFYVPLLQHVQHFIQRPLVVQSRYQNFTYLCNPCNTLLHTFLTVHRINLLYSLYLNSFAASHKDETFATICNTVIYEHLLFFSCIHEFYPCDARDLHKLTCMYCYIRKTISAILVLALRRVFSLCTRM